MKRIKHTINQIGWPLFVWRTLVSPLFLCALALLYVSVLIFIAVLLIAGKRDYAKTWFNYIFNDIHS
ncbi:MAG: hypothetical protein LBU42_04400 [Prevotellaceae bacterium]|jgi:hypothetical protein|nr:hypothetical protein [Prevotellaceae bacterium]